MGDTSTLGPADATEEDQRLLFKLPAAWWCWQTLGTFALLETWASILLLEGTQTESRVSLASRLGAISLPRLADAEDGSDPSLASSSWARTKECSHVTAAGTCEDARWGEGEGQIPPGCASYKTVTHLPVSWFFEVLMDPYRFQGTNPVHSVSLLPAVSSSPALCDHIFPPLVRVSQSLTGWP